MTFAEKKNIKNLNEIYQAQKTNTSFSFLLGLKIF